jgi:hypothetical protein
MIHARTAGATLLFGCLAWLAASLALAQSDAEAIHLVLSKPGSTAPLRNALGRDAYRAIRGQARQATVEVLPLTRAELWIVPKARVDAVSAAAARRGVTVERQGVVRDPALRAPTADMDMSDKQKLIFDQAKASLATVGIKMMTLPTSPMFEYALTRGAKAPAPRMTIELNDRHTVTVIGKTVDKRRDMYVFRGAVEGTDAPATLMWWPDGKMVGTVQHDGRIYTFRHMGGLVHAVVEMSTDRMPSEHAPMPERLRSNDPNLRDDPLIKQGDASVLRTMTAGMRPRAPLSALDPRQPPAKAQKPAAPGRDVVIDVIVAYTVKAAGHYTDIRRELVDLAIEEANESFRQSQLPHVKLRLVHAYQTDYAEGTDTHFDHVWRFADKGDGYMEEIHELRDKHRADVGILIVDDPKGCGLATRVYADPEEAFAVVHHECAASTYSFAHEIGHLIGARHELSIDTMMTPFPYGHGYVNGTKWRDIMSYKESCGGCPRLPVWSSPKVLVRGEPAGTPALDNARVIAEQAARVAGFR